MNQETIGQLLLDCLHCREIDETRTAELNSLRAADWESLVQFAVRQRVVPLLYHRLKTVYPSVNLPTSLKQKLQKISLASGMHNAQLYSELSKIIKAFQNKNIPVIVLKGAHLAQNIYGDITLRSMGDVDILVRKTDLLKAEEKLLEMGYSSSRVNLIEVACAKHHHLPPLVKPDTAPVEIHWTIDHPTSPFTIDVEGLWNRARPATIAGVEVLVLSPEDLLLHLCLHTASQDIFLTGLRPFYDIWKTIQHYRDEIEWEQVWLRARQWGASNSVYLTLYLAKAFFGAAVPDEVLDTLKPENFDPQVATWAKEQIFNNSDENVFLSGQPVLQLWKSKSILEKANVIVKRVFLSPEQMARRYHVSPDSPRLYLYYPVRLKYLLFRYGRRVWWLLRRDKENVNLAERKFELREWLSR